MKKIILSCLILFSILLQVACSGASKTDTTASDGASSANTTGELTLPTQLLISTLKLEGTDLAVDTQQASELLPLWQAYNELAKSDTAAQAEIDAVIAQIQATMTPQQVKAITDMKLTQQDEFSLMQGLGLVTNFPNASGTPSASSGEGQVFVPGAGEGFPGGGSVDIPGGRPSGGAGGGPSGGAGGYPGAGVVPGGDQGFDPQRMATAQARGAQSSGMSARIPTLLLNALIDLLQKRAQP